MIVYSLQLVNTVFYTPIRTSKTVNVSLLVSNHLVMVSFGFTSCKIWNGACKCREHVLFTVRSWCPSITVLLLHSNRRKPTHSTAFISVLLFH